MDSEIWARCAKCQTELQPTDTECPKCGSATKNYARTGFVTVGTVASTKMKQKRKGLKRPLREAVGNRLKISKDKLKGAVREDMNIDREKNHFDHVVRDAETGQITHEEHEPLSEHNEEAKQNTKKTQHNPNG